MILPLLAPFRQLRTERRRRTQPLLLPLTAAHPQPSRANEQRTMQPPPVDGRVCHQTLDAQ
jgi:hypothetical protein